jgi:Tfp pilus assembly PilM family ATPase
MGKFKKRGPVEILGVDVAHSALKLVRLKKNGKDGLILVAADILPACRLLTPDDGRKPQLDLPRELRANYAAAAISIAGATAKLISLQQSGSGDPEVQIKEQFGAGDEYRLASISAVAGRQRAGGRRFLVAGLHEEVLKNLLTATSSGPPALRSCEVSALAALTAFSRGRVIEPGRAVCFMEIGARSAYLFFLHSDAILLLRKYDVGADVILDKIIADFHVDRQTAANIMSEGAIDLSQLYADELGFLARQTAISRDFVERQENCSVSRIVVSGGLADSKDWIEMLRQSLGIEVDRFDPLKGLEIEPEALSPALDTQRTRLTAAVGAAIGGLTLE